MISAQRFQEVTEGNEESKWVVRTSCVFPHLDLPINSTKIYLENWNVEHSLNEEKVEGKGRGVYELNLA